MTETYCLSCAYWQRLEIDKAIGSCRIGDTLLRRAWRFQLEGEDCQSFARCNQPREPFHEPRRKMIKNYYARPLLGGM